MPDRTTFSAYRCEGRQVFTNLVLRARRPVAEQAAVDGSRTDPRRRVHVLERDDNWKIAGEYRDGRLLLHRPHDKTARRRAGKNGAR